MRVFVKIEERGMPSRYVPFEGPQMRVGRRPDGNHIVLEKKSVSRKHMLLAFADGRFVVADLTSAGGTFVNGLRVTAPVVVRPGDRIVVGEYVLTVVPEGPETDSVAFDEQTPSEPSPDQTDARDDVAFGDVGESIDLHHARGGVEWERFRREVLVPAFAHMPGRPPPSDAERRQAVGVGVSTPRVFPGGDVGALAVALAAGYLAEQGAELTSMTVDLFLEEGLGLQELHRFLRSMRTTAWDEKVKVDFDDVEVLEAGTLPGAVIRFVAVGRALLPPPDRPQVGDVVVLSGPCGSHGGALKTMEAQTSLPVDVFSDTAPTSGLVASLARSGVSPRYVGFPFRGGVAHALHSLARRHQLRALVREGSGYLDGPLEQAALRLDLDPLFEPSAGRLLAVLPPAGVDGCLKAWEATGAEPVVIGELLANDDRGSVVIGTPTRHKPLRRYQMPEGEL